MSKSIGSLVLAFLAITAVAAPARADLFDFTASIQTYTVATTGVYTITSAGAQGGPSEDDSGGFGAVVSGNVLLTAGTVLDIVVGQEGGDGYVTSIGGGGGGGGSFVYEPTALQPLEAAGGGGGAAWHVINGSDALTGTSGGSGQGASGGAGGTSGGGGAAGGSLNTSGGGGAGWTGDGGTAAGLDDGGGGQTGASWLGGAGNLGADGGYGGGGGGGYNGGGGGGGYSGGGGGDDGNDGGGGGGSYIDPSFFSTTPIAITQTGDGFVSITPDFVPTPEPGAVLLLASAVIGLGFARRRRLRTR